MAIIHLGHQPRQFSGAQPAWLSTDAADFDADYDVNGLRVPLPASGAEVPFHIDLPGSFQTVRVGFRYRAPLVVPAPTTGGVLVEVLESNGDHIGSITTTTNPSPGYSTGTGVARAGPLTPVSRSLSAGESVYLELAVMSNGSNAQVTLFVDGVTVAFTTITVAQGPATRLRFPMSNIQANGTADSVGIAHIVVDDSTGIGNRRFIRRTPADAATTETGAWVNTPTNLDDDSYTTAYNIAEQGRSDIALEGPSGPGGATVNRSHIRTRFRSPAADSNYDGLRLDANVIQALFDDATGFDTGRNTASVDTYTVIARAGVIPGFLKVQTIDGA